MRPAVALGVVVGVLAATVGAAEGLGSSVQEPTAAPAPITAPLIGARLVCPDVVERTVGHISRITRVGVAVPPPSGGTAPSAGGVVTATPLRAKRTSAPLLTAPGRALVVGGPAYQGDVVIDATGMLASGLAADELGRRDGGTYRGIDGVACTSPRDSAWLIGASTSVGAHAELRLTNTDDVIALVDIGLFGPSGPVNAHNAIGLSVGARSTRTIRLETLAPAQSLLMLNVRARSGRVAVALRQQLQSASTPLGEDWVPLAQPPSRTALVPGLTAGLGPRKILLGNPGDIDATASIRLVRSDSSFVPRGLATITVPAGGAISVDVTKALDTKAGAAVVTADRAVVTGALLSTGPRLNGFAEQAFSAGSPALTGPTATVVDYVRRRNTQLLLTAPSGAANVRVTTLAGGGPSGGHTTNIHIAAGRTVVYDLVALSRGALLVAVAITPTAGSGPVYGARDEFEFGAHGPMFTVLPLFSAPQSAVIPPTAVDLRAGLPR
jgi:hypothetical protein